MNVMVKIQELYDVIFHTAFEGFRVRHQKQTAKPARNRSYKE
ncbi:YnzJ [Bacillus subtilis subsp. subtilis 6051-HGW]|nr:YnzJ [Bacillus subtilis subsp. subtilis 6051-HGW]